jgi:hypothetical protein
MTNGQRWTKLAWPEKADIDKRSKECLRMNLGNATVCKRALWVFVFKGPLCDIESQSLSTLLWNNSLCYLFCLRHNIYVRMSVHLNITYLLTYLLTYLITPWSRILLEKLTVSQLVKKFPACYRTRKSLPPLQVPATCSYPETHQSSPHPFTLLPEDLSLYYPPIHS